MNQTDLFKLQKEYSYGAYSSPITSSLRTSIGELEGWVYVKRKFLARKRHRYLKLNGSVLTCQKTKKTSIEWDVSLLGCRVRPSRNEGSIIITFPSGTKAYITLVPNQNRKAWVEAIRVGSSHKFEDLYEIHEKIGEGGFAKVHSGRDKETGREVAIKVIRKNVYDMQATREVEREMQIMKTLNHPRIIKTHDIFHVQDRVYIVMELMHGGTLKERIQAAGGTVAEGQARELIREVLEACVYLHSNGVVHRDIKLENVLCRSKQTPIRDTTLADFGYVNFLPESGREALRSLVGTPLYVAAEIIERKPYGPPVDIYACGIMAYRMISGFYPYHAEDDEQIMQLALKAELSFPPEEWSSASAECLSFLKALLNPNPHVRLTAEAALAHPWFIAGRQAQLVPGKPRSSLSQRITRFGQRITTVTAKNQNPITAADKQLAVVVKRPEELAVARVRNATTNQPIPKTLRGRILAVLFLNRICREAGISHLPGRNLALCRINPPPRKHDNVNITDAGGLGNNGSGRTQSMRGTLEFLPTRISQNILEGLRVFRRRAQGIVARGR